MQHKNKQTYTEFDDASLDDANVLTYLLQHVRGLSPSSLDPAYVQSSDTDTE